MASRSARQAHLEVYKNDTCVCRLSANCHTSKVHPRCAHLGVIGDKDATLTWFVLWLFFIWSTRRGGGDIALFIFETLTFDYSLWEYLFDVSLDAINVISEHLCDWRFYFKDFADVIRLQNRLLKLAAIFAIEGLSSNLALSSTLRLLFSFNCVKLLNQKVPGLLKLSFILYFQKWLSLKAC